MTQKDLTPFERHVIEEKGTEAPFSGLYTHTDIPGGYHCKRCQALLYRSEDKFPSHCGWPSFDDEVPGAVRKVTDADRAKANEEAVGGVDPIEATEADNPSPGRNAVPVSAPRTTKEGLVIPEGYEESDLIPGTNVPQTAAPKAGDYTR